MFDFLKGKKPITNFEYDIINNTNKSGFFPQNDDANESVEDFDPNDEGIESENDEKLEDDDDEGLDEEDEL